VVFGVVVVQFSHLHPDLSFIRDTGLRLGLAFYIWVFVMVAASSNGVNLTDGLDGLASGSSALVLAAYVIISFWEFRHTCPGVSTVKACYHIGQKTALDLAIAAAGSLGSVAGFLWWNAAPARIFMGDTGALALGGLLAGLAIMTSTQLLLLILAISGAVSALGTANFTTRVAYSWGREGYLPAAFGRTHPKFRTPSVANGALAVTTLGIILAGAAWKGQTLDLKTFFLAGFVVFSWLLLCGAAGILPVYALVGLSGFAHSLRNHGTVVDIVIAPLLAVAVVATAEFTQFYHQTGANKIAPLVMVAWVVLGVIVRLATRSRVRAAEAQFDAAPAEAGIQSADMAG